MENNNDNIDNSENEKGVGFSISQETVACKNCEKKHQDGFEFCPHCGQKTNEDLTVGVLFYNTISNYFSFDARFLKSFIPLMFKPGYLAKRFLEGKRLLYLHPAQMYLFISVVFFFITSFAVREKTDLINKGLQKVDFKSKIDSINVNKPVLDSVQLSKLMNPLKNNKDALGLKEEDLNRVDSIINTESKNLKNSGTSFDFNEEKVDSLIAIDASENEIYKEMGMSKDAGYFQRKFFGQILKFYKDKGAGSILQAIFDTIPIALFFLLPIFALILKLLYYNKGRYAHHLVFSFYYFSFLFTAFSLIYGANMIWDIPDWIDTLLVLCTFFYLLLAIKRFYEQGWFLSFFKSSVASFLFLLFVVPLSLIFITLFAIMFY